MRDFASADNTGWTAGYELECWNSSASTTMDTSSHGQCNNGCLLVNTVHVAGVTGYWEAGIE